MFDREYPVGISISPMQGDPPGRVWITTGELYVDEKGAAWVRLVDKEDSNNFLSITQDDFERRRRHAPEQFD